MGIRCADHATPLYPKKLALNSPTGGGRSVGIVRSRTKATEVFYAKNFAGADGHDNVDVNTVHCARYVPAVDAI